ncbi:MAG: putative extracellular repeat, family [Capsulimonas sp.]|nr:putative extracellular repeat, family [Capsulimonas sp.]
MKHPKIFYSAIAVGVTISALYAGSILRSFRPVDVPIGPHLPVAHYRVTDLGAAKVSFDWVSGVNDRGDIVGVVAAAASNKTKDGDPRQALAIVAGNKVVMGLPQHMAVASAINNHGEVAGTTGSKDTYRAFFWKNGKLTDLGALGGVSSYGCGVNDKGQVVGFYETPDNNTHSFLWERGAMRELPLPLGALARDINNQGEITGIFQKSAHAFLSSAGGAMIDLGDGDGRAINASGVVAGYSGGNACAWKHSQIVPLPALAPRSSASAFDINDLGQIVGHAQPSENAKFSHAVLWQNGKAYDLNSLIDPGSPWELQVSEGINNKGQIVGVGEFKGAKHTFLLTPVG